MQAGVVVAANLMPSRNSAAGSTADIRQSSKLRARSIDDCHAYGNMANEEVSVGLVM